MRLLFEQQNEYIDCDDHDEGLRPCFTRGAFFFLRELSESSCLDLASKENKLLQTHTKKKGGSSGSYINSDNESFYRVDSGGFSY